MNTSAEQIEFEAWEERERITVHDANKLLGGDMQALIEHGETVRKYLERVDAAISLRQRAERESMIQNLVLWSQ